MKNVQQQEQCRRRQPEEVPGEDVERFLPALRSVHYNYFFSSTSTSFAPNCFAASGPTPVTIIPSLSTPLPVKTAPFVFSISAEEGKDVAFFCFRSPAFARIAGAMQMAEMSLLWM